MQKTITKPFETDEKPSYNAYYVRNRKGGISIWKKIGEVWPHKDLKGWTVQIYTVPLDGRIVIRTRLEEDE